MTTAGQTLTTSSGTWGGSPAPSFSYQWQQCDGVGLNCSNVPGATAASYQLIGGDVGHMITVVVTGANGSGSAAASAAPIGPVAAATAPPQNQAAPLVGGTAMAGQTLSASPGTWSGSPVPSSLTSGSSATAQV